MIFLHKNVYRIRFQKIKIRPLKGFEKKAFFSLFLMRKRLSSGQKWFLRPYFPLISEIFVFRSGLRFSFQGTESEEKVILDLFLTLRKKVRKPPILISWNLILYTFLCTKIKKITIGNFFSLDACSSHMCYDY